VLRLWDPDSGKELRSFGPASTLYAIAFAPDGRTVLSAGPEGCLVLRETASGQERCRFAGHGSGAVYSLAFAPDGRRVISGGAEGTALIWDVTGGQPPGKVQLSPAELETLWRDLGGQGEGAHPAIWTLALAPGQAVPFLRERLRPVPVAEPKRLARLIADLDDDAFVVREQATRELEQLGDAAAEALRQALRRAPSPEVRQRAEALLDRLDGARMAADVLRGLRAVEALEQAGTPEARQLLEALARGAEEARLTREARAALDRRR
jgi:hypothetical protein